MAERYQDRPFPADDRYDRGADQRGSARAESDPLAELARLIGQTDPFGTMGQGDPRVQPRTSQRDHYQEEPAEDGRQAGPPPWLQRAVRQEAPQQAYPGAVHPVHRYATPVAPPEPDYHDEPQYADHEADSSRYDDALYGQIDSGQHQSQHDPAYADDGYAYDDEYSFDDAAEEREPKRRGGLITVAAILLLAVVGTGGAFAYRTYVGSPRSGEPPIIKADAGPTKIVPAPADSTAKLPDRLVSGEGTEKIVPREEAPIDVNAKSGARVVFPALNQNANPPPAASVAPSAPLTSASNGTLSNSEPKKIKTLSVRGDQPDGAAMPVGSLPPATAKPASTPAAASPRAASTSASTGGGPLSLAPQAPEAAAPAEPRTRVATTNPTQAAAPSSGGYLVQVSSQRNEADAQTSFRSLQSKFPAVLGSRSPVIKRADLGEKGIYYRAMVGPFGTPDEASQFCSSLKTAGGQCVVQRN
jgi:hypothetical protein